MFPHNMELNEVSEIVREHNAKLDMKVFIEADRDDHVIFNYLLNFEGVFPDFTGDPEIDRTVAILRECRGLIFDKDSGLVISRRFHKFWNLNQRPETQIGEIDFSRSHIIMDKLDGSMIAPFKTSRSGVRKWGTKMGATDVALPVEQHVAANSAYEALAKACDVMNVTPIFEWCSRQQRIVIDYPEDQLILTHVRDIKTGSYAPRDVIRELGEEFGIPTVRVFEHTIEDIHEFVEHTRGLQNLEGYVVHFDDDLMLKLKADEYCMLHNTKEKLNFEKNVVEMVFADGIDDMLPQLDENDRRAVSQFLDDAMAGVAEAAREISELAASLRAQIVGPASGGDDIRETRKQYAALVNSAVMPNEFAKRLLFRAFDTPDLVADVIKIVVDNTGSSTKIESIRPLIGGINWNNYRGFFDAEG